MEVELPGTEVVLRRGDKHVVAELGRNSYAAGLLIGGHGEIDVAVAGMIPEEGEKSRPQREDAAKEVMTGLIMSGLVEARYTRIPFVHRKLGRTVFGNLVYRTTAPDYSIYT